MVSHAYRHFDDHRGREDRIGPPTGARSPVRRLLSAHGALLDRAILRGLEPAFLSGYQPDYASDARARIEETRRAYATPELLADPASFHRAPELPARIDVRETGRLRGGRRLRLSWRSTYRTWDPAYQADYDRYAGNETNHVVVYRHDGRPRPTLLCIHAWCCGLLWAEERIFAAESFHRLGFNVALFTMPFHGARTPGQARFSGQLFPSRELRRSNEAFGQAIADLRVLLAWIRGELASDTVGAMGISLGGYTTALLASVDGSLAFAIPMVAPASFADVLWHHGQGRGAREDAERAGFSLHDFRTLWHVHAPVAHAPKLPKDRALILWTEGDRIVPGVHQLALWEHWGRPAAHAFAGGHVLHAGRLDYLRTARRWLRERVSGLS